MKKYGTIQKANGNDINIYTEGTGKFTIVMMSGSGVTSPVLEYRTLYKKLADQYRIAVVEKPGYGLSGHAVTERTVENMVDESREALRLAGILPPYILAPHSYSGFEAVYWANTYPDEVKAVLGIDMGIPDMALLQAEALPEDKKKQMLEKYDKFLAVIQKRGLMAKLAKNKTVNASGLISGNALSDREKELYTVLFYKNMRNPEINEEAIRMTENAKKAHATGVLKCPACFFISNMKSPVKTMTWQEAGITYAKKCGGEYHLSDQGHFMYAKIPDKMAETFKTFLNNLAIK